MISTILKSQVSSFPLLKSTIVDSTLFNPLQSFAILFQKKKKQSKKNKTEIKASERKEREKSSYDVYEMLETCTDV